MVVLAACSAVWVAVPRPVAPQVIPMPRINAGRSLAQWESQAELARRARTTPLPISVRSVGEHFRRFGLEVLRHDSHAADYQRGVTRQQLADVLNDTGPDPLLTLRAIQTELFVRAVQASILAGAPTPDLRELGGHFYQTAVRSGWIQDSTLNVTPAVLGSLFRARWSLITGLDRAPFAPSLTDELEIAWLNIRMPATPPGAQTEPLGARLDAIRVVTERQPDYPLNLARGIVLFQAGKFTPAAAEFDAHLTSHPEGPWTLRAVNYLAATHEALGWL